MQNHLPQHPKRIETVHAETLEGELCLYDWQRMQVHNLNPTAARVWELCDGQTTPQQMAAQLHGDLTPAQAEELVWLTLKRLEKAHLLENAVVKPGGHKVYTRREMLAKLGVTAMMLPVITSIVAPSPVAAQSSVPGPVAVCRVVTVGTLTAGGPVEYFPFTPITDAELAGLTSITFTWTGDPGPSGIIGFRLAQNITTWANGYYSLGGVSSPVTATDPAIWTGNRPYNGIAMQNATGTNWNAGDLEICLR